METLVLWLSMVIFFEARGEPVECQINVAQVVMNRMKHYSSVVETVLAPHQFSWVESKMVNGVLKTEYAPDRKSTEWKTAMKSARQAITNGSIFKGTYFHSITIPKPSSWNKLVRVKTCGNHHFYKEET